MEAVLPFDVLLDRGKRSRYLNILEKSLETQTKQKVVRDAGIALASMVICEEALERELIISTSYVPLSRFSLNFCSVLTVYQCSSYTMIVRNKNQFDIAQMFVLAVMSQGWRLLYQAVLKVCIASTAR